MTTYQDFSARMDAFVQERLAGVKLQLPARDKVIHDCVWGTVAFSPWEMQLLDSPLLQRLRHVLQLGIAVLTYPSANHSRFEHTIGVAAVASDMIRGIERGSRIKIPPAHVAKIRLAALLHDVGHCFFSHESERTYANAPEMAALRAENPIFAHAQAHEILGYLIINTPSFCTFFERQIAYPYVSGASETAALLAEVGGMIIGAPQQPVMEDGRLVCYHYLTELINGQFDADAIDYLCRDAYATGLSVTFNIDRFLYQLKLAEVEEYLPDGTPVRAIHLTIPTSGVTTVEEMAYSKLMLTRYIYQHQKVIAGATLWNDLASGLSRAGILTHPADFLSLTDEDIYMLDTHGRAPALTLPIAALPIWENGTRTISDVAHSIVSRNLPVRALVLNANTVVAVHGKTSPTVGDIAAFLSHEENLRVRIAAEANAIAAKLGKSERFVGYEVYTEVPKIYTAKDYSGVRVQASDGAYLPMRDVAKLKDWTQTFAETTWNAYIFADRACQPLVTVAALRVLRRAGLTFHPEHTMRALKNRTIVTVLLQKLGDTI